MPLFEYRCPKCGYSFEKLILKKQTIKSDSTRFSEKLKCPKCGNSNLKKQISGFYTPGKLNKCSTCNIKNCNSCH